MPVICPVNDPTVSILVDEEDYAEVALYRWYLTETGHVSCMGRGTMRSVLMHRYIVGRYSTIPKGTEVDHWNLNGCDNRRSNLRVATRSQNEANQPPPSNNTSGYKGVGPHRRKWRAQITTDYRNSYLGLFDTREEAAIAYDIEARKRFGEFARLNIEHPDATLVEKVLLVLNRPKRRAG